MRDWGFIIQFKMNIYPDNFEQKIEFESIRKYLREKCLSPLGIEKVNSMQFSTDFAAINSWLDQTSEFLQIITRKENFPRDHYLDVRASLFQMEKDSSFWFSEDEIPLLVNSLKTIIQIVDFLQTKEDGGSARIKYPELKKMSEGIKTFSFLIEKATAILDKSGQIKDNASKLLATVRKSIIDAEKDISKAMIAAIRVAQSQGIIDKDTRADMRGDHFSIPVAASNKRKIKGVVRGSSGSGRTFFIEPEEVVEASNRMRELQSEEKREIARILVEFTDCVRPELTAILRSYDFLAMIDFTQAKALFAHRIRAIKPNFENRQNIEWQNAFHPLLDIELKKQHKSACPLDIQLTPKDRVLLVSGVNAGGKSLCLKTVALLQYMLQSGLLIPVEVDSNAGIFKSIFMDIGDGQSMENSLSTYTSHLTNMKFFIEHSQAQTLLLIDEFGGGTEPQIGGAIAETILERFNKKGSFGLITTHFQNLKQYAYKTDGVINGAMLYDSENNKPMFKLSIGSPGSSFAIEVARRIGLDESIIKDASNKLGEDFINMDHFLQSIQKDKLFWENRKKEVATNASIPPAAVLCDFTVVKENRPLKIEIKPKEFKIGDAVYLEGQSVVGIILELKGNEALVAFGVIKSKVKLNRLIIKDNE